MSSFTRSLKKNYVFIITYLLILSAGVYLCLTLPKADLHLKVNDLVGRSSLVDLFFKYITFLGDGFVVILICVIISWRNVRQGAYLLTSYILSALASTILKYNVFENFDRPKALFDWHYYIPLKIVEGESLQIHNSFPSGHTTSAFALFIGLAFLTKSKSLKLLFLMVACMVGFSRVYLSQHFQQDVLAGSFLGFITAFILYYFFYIQSADGKASVYDKSLKSFIQKKSK